MKHELHEEPEWTEETGPDILAVLPSLRRDVERMDAVIEACDSLENAPGFGLRKHPQFEAELFIRGYAETLREHYRERLMYVECAAKSLKPLPRA